MILYDLFDTETNEFVMRDVIAREIAERISYRQTWIPSRVGRLLKGRWIIEHSQTELAKRCNKIPSKFEDPAWIRDFIDEWTEMQKLFGIATQ